MLKFSEIILEAREKKPPKEREFNLNDAKGKLYEILTGSHLHHGTGRDGMPNSFLTHYRDEEGKSPKEVHDYIKAELDKRNPGAYEEILRHSTEGAQHLRDQLAAHGHGNINETAWTSQKGDHHKFTGEHDPNSDADIMVRTENGPVGLSLKYGKSKDMNLRNPGLETLEKAAGLNPGELDALREQHNNHVKNNLGIRDHAHYKELRAAGGTSQHIVDAADASALSAQKTMAKKVADGLSARAEQDPEFLRNYVKNTISPQTKYQHFRLHTRPDDRGNSTHHLSDMQDDASKLDNFEHFRVVPHNGDTISYRIEGRRKGSDAYEPVLDQGIKKGSGPMKGFAGMTKAPFLTKVDKKKGALSSPAPAAAPVAAPVENKPAPVRAEPAVRNKPAPSFGVAGDNPDSPMHNWVGSHSGHTHGGIWKDREDV
jgi:hypothetical protein